MARPSKESLEKMAKRLVKVNQLDGVDTYKNYGRYVKVRNTLRNIISQSGLRLNKISKMSGVPLKVLQHFQLSAVTEMEMHYFEILCEFFNLNLSIQIHSSCTLDTKPS